MIHSSKKCYIRFRKTPVIYKSFNIRPLLTKDIITQNADNQDYIYMNAYVSTIQRIVKDIAVEFFTLNPYTGNPDYWLEIPVRTDPNKVNQTIEQFAIDIDKFDSSSNEAANRNEEDPENSEQTVEETTDTEDEAAESEEQQEAGAEEWKEEWNDYQKPAEDEKISVQYGETSEVEEDVQSLPDAHENVGKEMVYTPKNRGNNHHNGNRHNNEKQNKKQN